MYVICKYQGILYIEHEHLWILVILVITGIPGTNPFTANQGATIGEAIKGAWCIWYHMILGRLFWEIGGKKDNWWGGIHTNLLLFLPSFFFPFLPSSMLQPRNLKESYHHISPHYKRRDTSSAFSGATDPKGRDQAPLLPFLSLSSLCLVIPRQGHGCAWQREPFGQRLKVVSGNQKVPGRHGEEGTGQRNPNIHPQTVHARIWS